MAFGIVIVIGVVIVLGLLHGVVLILDIEELLGLVAVHQIPPPTGLPHLVEDGPVGAEAAELDAVQVLPGHAGVVHLAESFLVSVVPVCQLLSAAKMVLKSTKYQVTDNGDLKDVSGTVARMG